VVKLGSGSGTIVASVGSIDCGSLCTDILPQGTVVTLTAVPDGDSQFVGWLGPCTGRDVCSFSVSGGETVSAGFAPVSLGAPRSDIDGNGIFQPLNDGVLIIRYLFGLTGQALIADAIGPGASRTSVAQITSYLNNLKPMLDVDGDGRVDGLTDGLLIGRYLFGLRGSSLTAGAVATNAMRNSSDSIETHLEALTGLTQSITFLSSPPSNATANGNGYAVSASATSGLPVTLSIDPSAASVCSISTSTVSFNGVGTCVINANQYGSAIYGPAARAYQSFAVSAAPSENANSTTFSASENPLSEGGRWINGRATGLDWNNVQSGSGHAYATAINGGYDDSIAVLATAFPPNQWAEGIVYRAAGYSPGTNHEVELLLRFRITAHSARGYEVLWGQDGEINIVRWNGPLGNYTPLGQSVGVNIGPAVNGDVLRAEIVGTQIKVYRNGSLVLSATDSTWSDGQPGIGFWLRSGATPSSYGWDAFSAGGM
jgi:hypothetical protein